MHENRTDRSSVIIRATISGHGLCARELRVRNLSEQGACVDHDGDLAIGASVLVAIGCASAMRAEVAWATPRTAGLRFVRRLDLAAARRPRGAGRVAAGWMAGLRQDYR